MSRATYQLATLTNSTNFLPINIGAIAPGSPTLIHTADSTNFDELWLDAYNYSSNDGFLYLMLGGSASHQILTTPIPAQRGLIPVVKGLRFTGGVVISAYASSANIISVIGSLNRIVFI